MLSSIKTITILGCGWLGLPLLRQLSGSGYYYLRGSSRNPERRREITAAGGRALAIDLPSVDAEAAKLAFAVDALVITLPPGRKRSNVKAAYEAEMTAIVKLAKQHGSKHIIYTSSTGVYGAAKGLVTEATATAPTTDSAEAVVAAEEQLKGSEIPTTILRLSGLFGPGREPGRWFQAGRVVKNGDAPINLVHQADVIQAIGWVLAHGSWNTTYNLSAAVHPSKREYYGQTAEKLGLNPPVFEPGGADGKRIVSDKIRRELGWLPVFDDLL